MPRHSRRDIALSIQLAIFLLGAAVLCGIAADMALKLYGQAGL
jgi:hypothetical protein